MLNAVKHLGDSFLMIQHLVAVILRAGRVLLASGRMDYNRRRTREEERNGEGVGTSEAVR